MIVKKILAIGAKSESEGVFESPLPTRRLWPEFGRRRLPSNDSCSPASKAVRKVSESLGSSGNETIRDLIQSLHNAIESDSRLFPNAAKIFKDLGLADVLDECGDIDFAQRSTKVLIHSELRSQQEVLPPTFSFLKSMYKSQGDFKAAAVRYSELFFETAHTVMAELDHEFENEAITEVKIPGYDGKTIVITKSQLEQFEKDVFKFNDRSERCVVVTRLKDGRIRLSYPGGTTPAKSTIAAENFEATYLGDELVFEAICTRMSKASEEDIKHVPYHYSPSLHAVMTSGMRMYGDALSDKSEKASQLQVYFEPMKKEYMSQLTKTLLIIVIKSVMQGKTDKLNNLAPYIEGFKADTFFAGLLEIMLTQAAVLKKESCRMPEGKKKLELDLQKFIEKLDTEIFEPLVQLFNTFIDDESKQALGECKSGLLEKMQKGKGAGFSTKGLDKSVLKDMREDVNDYMEALKGFLETPNAHILYNSLSLYQCAELVATMLYGDEMDAMIAMGLSHRHEIPDYEIKGQPVGQWDYCERRCQLLLPILYCISQSMKALDSAVLLKSLNTFGQRFERSPHRKPTNLRKNKEGQASGFDSMTSQNTVPSLLNPSSSQQLTPETAKPTGNKRNVVRTLLMGSDDDS